MKKMNVQQLVLGVSALLSLVACGKKNENKAAEAPKFYETVVVSSQNAVLETVYPATIKGQQDVEIRPRVDGFIEAVYVDEGASVKKGEVLFKINSPQTEQAVISAQAALTSAEAKLNTAKVDVDRIKPLAEKGIISNVQLQMYENAYQSALSSLKQAQSTLINAQETRSWASVKSPVDGMVGSILFRQGSLVNSTNTLTTVANTSTVFAYFSLNEKESISVLKNAKGDSPAAKIKQFPAVSLSLIDGSVYQEKGKVETISGVVDSSTGSVNYRAAFSNKEGVLKSGSSGNVTIPQEVTNVFVIPQKATFMQQDKVLTYKVQGDSVVQTILTVKAMPDGQHYAVMTGLNAGERIVSDGVATLSNGKKIAIKQ